MRKLFNLGFKPKINLRQLASLFVAGLVCFSVVPAPRSYADTGLTVTNGAGGQGTNAWGTPANAQGTADNNTYATASPANNARVAGIWNTYNFDSNLPLHAVITKVEIIPQYKLNTNLSTGNLEVQAVVSGTNCPSAPFVHSTQPTVDTSITVDVTSCRAWTRANLLNSSFGTRISAHRANLLVGVSFTLDFVQVRVTYDTPDYDQSAYRWFDNADSAATGAALTNTDTAATLYSPMDRIRLRMLLHVTNTSLLVNSEQFKLQFAAKDASCTGLAYTDVTSSTVIAYYNNSAPASGISLTTSANDPQHAGDSVIAQTYNESAPFSTTANTAIGQDGLWDIALIANGAPANTTYCFRMAKNTGTAALAAYTVYPELTTSSTGSLGVDIVDGGGSSVASPSFDFNSVIAPVTCSSASSTIGTEPQKIRIKNTTATPGWSLSIAATSGIGSLWSAGTPKYDFNDGAGSPAGCSAGLDSDTYAGQMAINASGGTVTPRPVSACTTTGITKGAPAAFSEGSINSITLMSGSASANTGCFWELTNVAASQTIPGGQAPGAYSINLTLTVVAN